MRRLPNFCFGCLCLSTVALAADERFEAATVRSNHTQDYGRLGVEGSRFLAQNQTLKTLLSSAYGLPEFHIQGPEWLGSERYDVAGQLPTGATERDAMSMLQTLLTERFRLQVHRGTVDMDFFELVEGKNGAKLKDYHAGDSLRITGFPSGARALTTAGP
jgi:uncharacterized protein (TIGR03435 family)